MGVRDFFALQNGVIFSAYLYNILRNALCRAYVPDTLNGAHTLSLLITSYHKDE